MQKNRKERDWIPIASKRNHPRALGPSPARRLQHYAGISGRARNLLERKTLSKLERQHIQIVLELAEKKRDELIKKLTPK